MSGSTQNIENEIGLVKVYLDRMKIDDLHDPSGPQYGAAVYYPTLKLQPYPQGGVDELPDRMSVAKNGLSVAAMHTCFYHNGNPDGSKPHRGWPTDWCGTMPRGRHSSQSPGRGRGPGRIIRRSARSIRTATGTFRIAESA